MNIGAIARRHGTTALLGLAIAGFGTATALAGSPPMPAALPAAPSLSTALPVAAPVAAANPRTARQAKAGKTIRIRRQAQAVPFFAFPPRI
ncbi:MAG: hypothetical protein JSR70_01925 [Proteobacteria bacterium]|nr:hypothetical protein [Pseudomonadota bacterium]